MTKPIHRLKKLYDQIPAMKCQQGCTDCCGAVPFTKTELKRIKVQRLPIVVGQSCPYAQNGTCVIYEDRPFICRLFGTTEEPMMTCPKGCGPEKKLTAKQAEALTADYRSIMVRGN